MLLRLNLPEELSVSLRNLIGNVAGDLSVGDELKLETIILIFITVQTDFSHFVTVSVLVA